MSEYLIRELRPQKRKKGRYNLFDTEGFLLSLSEETVLRHSIKEDMVLSEEFLEMLRKEDTIQYAKELAMGYIAYAPRTEYQVREHLKKKGIDEKSIEEAITSLYYYNYLDDAVYVSSFVKSYAHKMGSYAMQQKLLERGVAKHVITENLHLAEAEERKTAKGLAEKQAVKYKGEAHYKKKQKLYAFLTRKGFSYDIIGSVIEEVLKETDEDIY
ncbi:MAG: hypothetical protein ACOX3W_01720 [Christensenellaceae bacterium]|jgi:regulatory protein